MENQPMGKSSSVLAQPFFEMTSQPFPTSPEETDPRLLEALRILNQISNAINRIGSNDATQDDLSLQLIVESAIRVVPGSSAVIYTYDQATGTLSYDADRSGSIAAVQFAKVSPGLALSASDFYTI